MENTNNIEKVIEDSKLELTQYLGVKLVFATPMTRGEFNKLKMLKSLRTMQVIMMRVTL